MLCVCVYAILPLTSVTRAAHAGIIIVPLKALDDPRLKAGSVVAFIHVALTHVAFESRWTFTAE